ncbi:MAG: tetratricopeptide repeat protein [Myxococcota bacterium]
MHDRIQTIFSVRAWIALSVLMLAIVGAAPEVHAQSDKDEAQELAQRGAKAFVKKDYAMAVTYFQRAASLDPNPVLLYNLSLAQSRLGNVEDARDAAQRAIDMGSENVPEDTWVKLHARRDAYDRALAGQAMAQDLAPDDPAISDQRGGEEGDDGTSVARRESEPESPISTIGWVGAGTGVAGVALLAGAGFVNADVRATIESYDDARRAGEFDRAETLQSEVESGQQLGQVLLYSGAGLAAVGTGLFVYDLVNGGESEKSATVTGVPRPGGASVMLHLRF